MMFLLFPSVSFWFSSSPAKICKKKENETKLTSTAVTWLVTCRSCDWSHVHMWVMWLVTWLTWFRSHDSRDDHVTGHMDPVMIMWQVTSLIRLRQIGVKFSREKLVSVRARIWPSHVTITWSGHVTFSTNQIRGIKRHTETQLLAFNNRLYIKILKFPL